MLGDYVLGELEVDVHWCYLMIIVDFVEIDLFRLIEWRFNWMHIFPTISIDYDWCEANPSGFDCLPVCMNG